MLRLLHVSDLHASAEKSRSQQEIVDALLRDVEKAKTQRPFDLIVMSGDLANAGTEDELKLGRAMLLDPLLTSLDLGSDRLILVPGNHDVDRSEINSIYESGMQQELKDLESVDAFVSEPDQVKIALARLESWNRFRQEVLGAAVGSSAAGLGSTYRLPIRDQTVGVAALNSSWRAQGGDEDKGGLLLSRAQVKAALSALDNSDVRIVVVHHPLSWLAPWDGDWARTEFEREPTLILSGHEHAAEPTHEITPRGEAIYGRAGCLYEHRSYPNSYAIIDVDTEAGEVSFELRTWQGRGDFDLGVNITQGGRMTLPWKRAGSSLGGTQPAFSVVLNNLADIVHQGSLLADQLPGEPAAPDDVLVAPRFWPLPYREMQSAARLDENGLPLRADPLDALDNGHVVIVSGDAQSGVSSALVWVLAQRYELDGTRAPAYLRNEGPNFKASRFRKALARALGRTGFNGTNPGDLPPVTIAVDDFATRNPGALAGFAKFVAENPEHLYVIGCHGAAEDPLTRSLEAKGLTVTRVYLGPFGRRELRMLVEKTAGAEAKELTQRILDITGTQHLPRNPFVIATLAAVLARKTDIKTLNESGLLDSYIGLLLGHDELVDDEGLAMDYRKREHVLSALAGHLYDTKKVRLSPLDAEAFVGAYIRQRGLTLSPGRVVQSLIDRRVLIRDDEGVGFRQPALRHFFAGKWMAEDREFAAKALAECMEYSGPIRHAAGLRRGDKELLAAVGAKAKEAVAKATATVNIEIFDAIEDRPGWVNDTPDAADLAKRLARRADERDDEEVEDELDRFDERFEMARTPTEALIELSPEILDLFPAVSLLSSVLRSSELVDDVDLKVRLLKEAIHGWSLGAIVVAIQEDQTSSLRERLRSNVADEETAATIERMAELILTVTFIILVHGALGGVHIEAVTREALDDSEFMAPTAHAMFATMLYALLGGEGWPTRLRTLYVNHRTNPLVAELALSYAFNTYRSPKTKQADLQALETFLGDVYSADGGAAQGKARTAIRAATKSQVLERLRKSRRDALRRANGQADFDELLDLDGDEDGSTLAAADGPADSPFEASPNGDIAAKNPFDAADQPEPPAS